MKTVRDIKLVIKDNAKVLETVVKETSTQPSELVKTLQEFQQSVNAALTKMIERSGDSVGDTMEVSEDEESEDEADSVVVTRKKRKK